MRRYGSLLLRFAPALALAAIVLAPGLGGAQAPIRIGLVQGLTGPFEVYAKQAVDGFKLGLEYGRGAATPCSGGRSRS